MSVSSNNEFVSVKVNLEKRMQIIEGWGTSLCWWANMLGKWEDEKKINEVCDLLFDAEKGIGINIVRYNIGGGENPPNVSNLRIGANMPCFLTKEGTWNWEADKGQRKILNKAIQKGADIFEAFSNTPPFWMTKNGSSAGADDRRNNLQEDQYGYFAEFLSEVVKHFKEEWGITFRTLSLFNEPIACWWHEANNQEGCFFDTNHQIKLLEEVIQHLNEKEQNETSIAAPEGWSVFDSIYSYGSYGEEVKSYISQINTHAYSGDQKSRSVIRSIAEGEKKTLWMSEVSCGGTEEHAHGDMSSAMELAKTICDYINDMGAHAWVYWQAVEGEEVKLNHGLIHANFKGTEEYWLTKQYYVFGNFSKFIRRGAVIIDCKREDVITAFDEDNRTLIIVAVNSHTMDKELCFDLSFMNNSDIAISIFRTSVNEDLKKIEGGKVIGGILQVMLKGKSVTTMIVPFIS